MPGDSDGPEEQEAEVSDGSILAPRLTKTSRIDN